VTISHFFINRPIFASVISIVIVILGAVSFLRLPIAQYPEIAPPIINVVGQYPGANAGTVAETVVAPIEQQINGVERMLYVSSNSTADGSFSIAVTFEIGTNLDIAQVQVQNRVAIATPRLPQDVRNIGVTVTKSSPDLMLIVNLYSPDKSRDSLFISGYANLEIKDVLTRVDGVGSITVFGSRDYAMRIWLDPGRLQTLGLTASDVVAALQRQNVQVAGGVLSAPPINSGREFQVTVTTKGRLANPDEFANIVVKTTANANVFLKDVARIELAGQDYNSNFYFNDNETVGIAVFQRPGSNALSTANAIRQAMREIGGRMPAGLKYEIPFDTTQYIAESVSAVVETMFEAVLLVILVVVLFLQTWRAAVIPILAIPISLIGTFFLMTVFGFTINNLTLFGLVLAIGIVVDDAIVVVENVERNIEAGMAPKEAAHKSMDEVGGALVAIALVLAAVFVPAAFITGISGQFYRQFALTIISATAISLLVSLTLSPAMCALLLKPHSHEEPKGLAIYVRKFFGYFNFGFDWFSTRYHWLAVRTVRIIGVMLIVYGATIALGLFQFMRTPQGFIPQQDAGYLITVVQLPPGAALARTDAVAKRVVQIARTIPGVNAENVVGFNGATFTTASNSAAVFLVLEPFATRGGDKNKSANAIQAQLSQKLAGIQEGLILVVQPPAVRGIGNAGGFRMMVQDRTGQGPAALQGVVYQMMGRAAQTPGLNQVFSLFENQTPQLYLDIDRQKALLLGVNISEVFSSLQTYIGSSYVNDFNLFGRTFRVTAQSDASDRLDPSDVLKIRVRNAAGQTVPLGSFTTVRDQSGPYRIPRYNLYPSAELDGAAAPGYSQGQAIEIMQKLAAEVLPAGYSYEWTGLAFQQIRAGNTAIYVFILATIFVFLVLAAQFESLRLPLAIILIVPMCLIAAIIGVWIWGQDNNILTQVGFIVLIAMASKNAILIVEFAKQIEDRGEDVWHSAVEAARLRLRPIIMTSLAFILGVLPMMLATGAGAELRQALGTPVVFGMLGVTAFGLIFTPVFYVVSRRIGLRRAAPPSASPSRPARVKS
jgi:hydrophobe/amphiphile efflux-1 (HAE1) family protein